MHYTPHYANLTDEGSPFARCLAMIERHAPRLMVAGGGSLSKEVHAKRLSPAERDAIRAALRATGGTGMYRIAKDHGVGQNAVRHIWNAMNRGATA